MKKLILIAVMSAFTFSIQAKQGAEGGGGGGMICFTPTNCKTLAEAGLVQAAPIPEITKKTALNIPRPPTPPVISERVVMEARAIIAKLPQTAVTNVWFYPGEFRVPDPDSETQFFIKVDIKDEKKFKKAEEEYLAILKENNQPTENFILAAFTGQEGKDTVFGVKTFLLPSFFKLNVRSQALILIHEEVIRKTFRFRTKTFNPVKYALAFDKMVLDVLDGKSLDPEYLTYMHETLLQSGRQDKYYYFSSLIRQLNQKIKEGIRYDISDRVSGSKHSTYSETKFIDLTTNKGSYELYQRHPGLWEILASENVERVFVEGLRDKDDLASRYTTDAEHWMKDTAEDWGIILSFDAKKMCQGAKDGHYLTSTHVIRCQNSRAILYGKIVYQLKNTDPDKPTLYSSGPYYGGKVIRDPYRLNSKR